MTTDMTQFYQVFFEETAEHLSGMESMLLELDVHQPDAEQLNAIFRAAHSIKGSAGTFGFTDLAQVTHVLENLLDRIRKGELTLRENMIDAFLDAGDILKTLLAAHRGEAPADPNAVAAICARLRELTSDAAPTSPDAAPPSPASPVPAAAPATQAPETAYGLFDDPAPASAAAAPADESYGFFEAVGDAAETAAAPAASASDGDGYGFFTDLPAPAPTAASEAAAAPTEAAPAKEASSPLVTDRRAAPRAGGGDTSIRVGVEKVDQLINLIGELVITQAMLAQSASEVDPVIFERLLTGLGQLERNTRDIQETVMSIRMMPISVVFSRFPRVVRDTSQKLGKQVELKTIGEGTELDKGLIERISDPLTHLIRNSLDHGIEMPEQRIAAGKQATGTITLKASHQSGNIVIEVGDDGAGLNRARILAKAKERGLPHADSMPDSEVWLLIFEAGFSTADVVTEVSGRGVGMDVVKRNITGMGGRVEIESMLGVGTRMTVRLPLTLAILDGMSVGVGRETYIIPIGYVIESLQASKSMIKSISGVERLIQVRGEYLPVVPLYEVFGIPQSIRALDEGIMVVLESDGAKVALFVDALIGQHQVVIKSLEANYRKVPGVSGATIMGDGHVAMILDVSALVGMAKNVMPVAA